MATEKTPDGNVSNRPVTPIQVDAAGRVINGLNRLLAAAAALRR